MKNLKNNLEYHKVHSTKIKISEDLLNAKLGSWVNATTYSPEIPNGHSEFYTRTCENLKEKFVEDKPKINTLRISKFLDVGTAHARILFKTIQKANYKYDFVDFVKLEAKLDNPIIHARGSVLRILQNFTTPTIKEVPNAGHTRTMEINKRIKDMEVINLAEIQCPIELREDYLKPFIQAYCKTNKLITIALAQKEPEFFKIAFKGLKNLREKIKLIGEMPLVNEVFSKYIAD